MDRLQLLASSMGGAQNVLMTVPEGNSPAELFAAMPHMPSVDHAERWEHRAARIVAAFNALADVPLPEIARVVEYGLVLRDLFAMVKDEDRMDLLSDIVENIELPDPNDPAAIFGALKTAVQTAKDTPT